MKTCKSCKSEIDDKATKCPHCQTDQRGWFRRHPVWTGILGIVLFFVLIGMASGGNKNNISNSSVKDIQNNVSVEQAKTEATPVPSPSVVEASALIAEFDKNKLSANDKYKGKLMQTSGVIKNISEDITGNYYLSIDPKTSDQFYVGTSIACYSKNGDQFKTLENKQPVTVQGVMGEMSLGIVVINECQVVK